MKDQSTKLQNTYYDVLLIMDACRYDRFNLYKDVEKVQSFAKNTPNFYRKLPNYIDISKHDLFTANAVPFHHYPEYNWNKSHLFDTINPEKNFREFKGMTWETPAIIHTVPPHLPWMYGKGREKIKKLELNPEKFPYKIRDKSYEYVVYSKVDNPMRFYDENLRNALKSVIPFVKKLSEQGFEIRITSDHSEGVTEEQGYEHIQGAVPWVNPSKHL